MNPAANHLDMNYYRQAIAVSKQTNYPSKIYNPVMISSKSKP